MNPYTSGNIEKAITTYLIVRGTNVKIERKKECLENACKKNSNTRYDSFNSTYQIINQGELLQWEIWINIPF